jgi:hypothetical protein
VVRDPGGLILRDSKHAVIVGEKLAKRCSSNARAEGPALLDQGAR